MNRIMNIKYVTLFTALILLGTLPKCAEEFDSPASITGTSLADVAATDTTLQIFTAALDKTGIGISLDNINSGQHTVFAPTDSAFRAYFRTTLSTPGMNDTDVIAYISQMSGSTTITLASFTNRLQHHIVSSRLASTDLISSRVFTTLSVNTTVTPNINNFRISTSVSGSNIFINGNIGSAGAKVRKRDINGSNGVIHTIDKFMTTISAANFFAGGNLGISVSYTTSPPTISTATGSGAPSTNFEVFSKALIKTKLALTLRPNVATVSLPDFTIFVPSDAAMVSYLRDTLDVAVTDEASAITFINSLADADPDADPPVLATTPSLSEFTEVIKYHIVSGRVLSTDLLAAQEIPTLLDEKTINVKQVAPSFVLRDGFNWEATISPSNALSNAGVLHTINAVLQPD